MITNRSKQKYVTSAKKSLNCLETLKQFKYFKTQKQVTYFCTQPLSLILNL